MFNSGTILTMNMTIQIPKSDSISIFNSGTINPVAFTVQIPFFRSIRRNFALRLRSHELNLFKRKP
jgi:hypothetical protein